MYHILFYITLYLRKHQLNFKIMIKSSIEKLAKEIGFDIGLSDDITQADLINGLSGGLINSMTRADLETQLCYIADKLDANSYQVLKGLVEFIELKNK